MPRVPWFYFAWWGFCAVYHPRGARHLLLSGAPVRWQRSVSHAVACIWGALLMEVTAYPIREPRGREKEARVYHFR